MKTRFGKLVSNISSLSKVTILTVKDVTHHLEEPWGMSSLLKGNSEVNRKRKKKEKESCIKIHYLKQQRWKDTSQPFSWYFGTHLFLTLPVPVANKGKNLTKIFISKLLYEALTLSWRRPLSYRNQHIDLLRKSMDWFLHENGLRHERVKRFYEGIKDLHKGFWNTTRKCENKKLS